MGAGNAYNAPHAGVPSKPGDRARAMTYRVTTAATAAVIAIVCGIEPQARAADPSGGDFDKRVFGGPLSKPKSYACFTRRYDAKHLAQHPLQKVSAMKLLLTAEEVPEDPNLSYSFRLGVKFRDRPGDFDSSGSCGRAQGEVVAAAVLSAEAEAAGVHAEDMEPAGAPAAVAPAAPAAPTARIAFDCGVDCDGGGISVHLANADKSVIVKLDQIRIWKGKEFDEAAATELKGGADDRMFRLDRTKTEECASLVTDRKELAALRHK